MILITRPSEGGRLHGGDSEKMILAIALLPPFKTPFSFSWVSSPSPTSLSAAVRNINHTNPQKIKKKCGEIQSLHCEKALTITNLSKLKNILIDLFSTYFNAPYQKKSIGIEKYVYICILKIDASIVVRCEKQVLQFNIRTHNLTIKNL